MEFTDSTKTRSCIIEQNILINNADKNNFTNIACSSFRFLMFGVNVGLSVKYNSKDLCAKHPTSDEQQHMTYYTVIIYHYYHSLTWLGRKCGPLFFPALLQLIEVCRIGLCTAL